jgi:hypothetical protein
MANDASYIDETGIIQMAASNRRTTIAAIYMGIKGALRNLRHGEPNRQTLEMTLEYIRC